MSKAPKAQRGAHPDGASRDGRWGKCSSWCVPEGRFECWLKRNTPTFCSIECPRTASQSPCLRARERDLERQLRLDACWTTAPSIYDGLVRHEKNTKGRSTRGGTPRPFEYRRWRPAPASHGTILDTRRIWLCCKGEGINMASPHATQASSEEAHPPSKHVMVGSVSIATSPHLP